MLRSSLPGLLVLKLLVVPAFVACVSIATQRWGMRIGGFLTALPMVAGPTFEFDALEKGPSCL